MKLTSQTCFIIMSLVTFTDCIKESNSMNDLLLFERLRNIKIESTSTNLLESNPFTRTVPSSFAIASSTASKSTATSYNVLERNALSSTTRGTASDEDFPQDFAGKKNRFRSVLEKPDTLTGCLSAIPPKFNLMRSTPSCYGPRLGYINHPDGMIAPSMPCGSGFALCLPPGDLGIWQDAEASGEACAATQLNALVDYTANKVDLAMGIFTAMVCVSEKDGNSLPAKGQSLDLVQSMNALTAPKGLVFKSATLERSSDDSASGRPIYYTKAEIAKQIRKLDNTTTSIIFFLTLKHSPASLNDYSNYNGVFNIEGKEPDYRAGLGIGMVKRGLSVVYEKSGNTLMYKMRNALFSSTATSNEMFNSDLEVNPKPASIAVPNGWAQDYNVMTSSLDDNGYGSVAYGWQANAQDGFFRTFNIQTKSDETATAYFGFADNNASGTGDLKIDRIICNWAGPNNDHTGKQKIQKQTMKYNIRYNLFVPVTSNITYAPTNSCDWNFTTNPTTRFEGVTSNGITNDLVDINTSYDFQLPSAPTPP